ncbi:MAG: AMP-binding protein [Rhodospirillaceae bacterium]|nr:AMP-binding protein [Rhodospirillaceae bacterium]
MKPPYSRTVFDLICEQAEIDPSRIVAIDAGASLTYRQLVERSSRVAMRLRKNGVRRGDRVGLLSDNRAEWLEIFFAAAALGAIVVPFSTWSTASELEFLLNDSEVRWLFTIDRFGEQVFTDAIVSDISAHGTN